MLPGFLTSLDLAVTSLAANLELTPLTSLLPPFRGERGSEVLPDIANSTSLFQFFPDRTDSALTPAREPGGAPAHTEAAETQRILCPPLSRKRFSQNVFSRLGHMLAITEVSVDRR